MSMLQGPAYIAGGTIQPCTFVTLSGPMAVSASGAGDDAVVGVSQEGSDRFDQTRAALSGEPVKVFGPGDIALLTVTAAVVYGNKLKPDTNAQGVVVDESGTTTAPQSFGAIALESANAGEKCRVLVQLGYYTYHA